MQSRGHFSWPSELQFITFHDLHNNEKMELIFPKFKKSKKELLKLILNMKRFSRNIKEYGNATQICKISCLESNCLGIDTNRMLNQNRVTSYSGPLT